MKSPRFVGFSWRGRLAGRFSRSGEQQTRRQDAGATTQYPSGVDTGDGSALDQIAQQLLGAAPLQCVLRVCDCAGLPPQLQSQESIFQGVQI